MSQWKSVIVRVFRFFKPLRTQPRFSVYFVMVIVVFGALGTWISLFRWMANGHPDILSVCHNFATYLIAIAVTGFADFVVAKERADDKTLGLVLFGILLISFIAAVLALFLGTVGYVLIISAVGAITTWILWLIVNDENKDLIEDDARSAIGGGISKNWK